MTGPDRTCREVSLDCWINDRISCLSDPGKPSRETSRVLRLELDINPNSTGCVGRVITASVDAITRRYYRACLINEYCLLN